MTKFTHYLGRIGVTRIGKGPLWATPLSSYNGSSLATSSASKFQIKIAMAVFISNRASLPYYNESQRYLRSSNTGSKTCGKWKICLFVARFATVLVEPSFWNKRVRVGKISLIVKNGPDRRAHLGLNQINRTQIVTFPGTKCPAIVMPSGGVSRVRLGCTAGRRRMPALDEV
jgi:hypothetical protein